MLGGTDLSLVYQTEVPPLRTFIARHSRRYNRAARCLTRPSPPLPDAATWPSNRVCRRQLESCDRVKGRRRANELSSVGKAHIIW